MGLSYGLGYSHARMRDPLTSRAWSAVPSRAPPQSPEQAAARREARAARGAAMSIEEEGRKRSSKRPAPQCPADAKR